MQFCAVWLLETRFHAEKPKCYVFSCVSAHKIANKKNNKSNKPIQKPKRNCIPHIPLDKGPNLSNRSSLPNRERTPIGATFTSAEEKYLARLCIFAIENAKHGPEQKGSTSMENLNRPYNDTFKPTNWELQITNRFETDLTHHETIFFIFRISSTIPS